MRFESAPGAKIFMREIMTPAKRGGQIYGEVAKAQNGDFE
jgi:hypothetical protein